MLERFHQSRGRHLSRTRPYAATCRPLRDLAISVSKVIKAHTQPNAPNPTMADAGTTTPSAVKDSCVRNGDPKKPHFAQPISCALPFSPPKAAAYEYTLGVSSPVPTPMTSSA